MQKTAVTLPHSVQQITNSSIDEQVRFLVRIVRLQTDILSLFLSQQTDNGQTANFLLHDEQTVKN
jgi:hypothetical protein